MTRQVPIVTPVPRPRPPVFPPPTDCGPDAVTGTTSNPICAGVSGYNFGTAIPDQGTGAAGVYGVANNGYGVYGRSAAQTGVQGESDQGDAVQGNSHSPRHAGVSGLNQDAGYGVYGWSNKGPAGHFQGDVEVTGDIRLLNSDCAEDFDLAGASDFAECLSAAGHPRPEAHPGTVMVLDDNGAVRPSAQAYDKRVAGVVSGAGAYRPAIILDRRAASNPRVSLALLGKVYCNVDAEHDAIRVGDLLTTSPRPGHTMKASDPTHAFGAVLGKALSPLASGRGLIPILVTLQ